MVNAEQAGQAEAQRRAPEGGGETGETSSLTLLSLPRSLRVGLCPALLPALRAALLKVETNIININM